ncbi:site-specific integrase [Wenzhouxiangella sp. XN24]|uniref:tyrosine-type recombinase/integrase n=1 Tax=Wenzhouxiangella sp. XN24 TaxID=2713569 RepID=UPI001F0DFEDB|nr:site-specific integrase [Wenzhouxiangella sp. XN24]
MGWNLSRFRLIGSFPRYFVGVEKLRVKLTTQLIAGGLVVPAGKRRTEYVDLSDAVGLYIEVRAASPGQGTFYWRYRDSQGITRHERIGRTDEVTLEQARNKARELRAQWTLGTFPKAPQQDKPEIPTFGEFARETYGPAMKLRKRSWQRDLDLVRLRLGDIVDKRLEEITKLDLVKLHNKLRESGLAAATSNHGLKVARQVLALAVSLEILEKNVAVGIPMFPENNIQDRSLSPEELARLLRVLKTDKNRNVCRIALWLLATGCRYHEALNAEWSQLDLYNSVWKVPSQLTKTNASRVIPLNDVALEVIAELDTKDKYPFLFINPRTKKPYANIHKVWERLRSDADVKHCRLHDLRHQVGAIAANSGESLWVISKLLGHTQSKTSERYSAVSTPTLVNASNTVARVIQEAMKKSA